MNIKKLICLLIIMMLTFTVTAFAATPTFTVVSDFQWTEVGLFSEGLCSVSKNGLYGFMDKTGKIIIKLQYQEAGGFSEGLCLVKQNSKYGFIDKSGRMVIAAKYEDADSFSEGLALVKMNGKYGYIDKTGKMVIAPQWVDATSFGGGTATIKSDKKIKYTSGTVTGFFVPYGVIDKTGKVISAMQWSVAEDLSGSSNLLKIVLKDKYGLLNAAGKIVAAPQWDAVGYFEDGFDIASYKVNNKWGIFDRDGKIITPPQYDRMVVEQNTVIAEGLIPVCKDSLWGYIDYTGKTVINPTWKMVSAFQNGVAIASSGDDKICYIDKTGKVLMEPVDFWDAASFIKDGFARASFKIDAFNSLFGTFDAKGNTIISPDWSHISDFRNGYAIANKGGRLIGTNMMGDADFISGTYHIIDSSGKVIRDLPWDNAEYLSDKYIKVVKYKSNEEGVVHIDPSIEATLKYTIIDITGKIIMESQFTDIMKLEGTYAFNEKAMAIIGNPGLLIAEKGEKVGLMTQSLSLVGNTYWDEFDFNIGNMLPVIQNGKLGLINLSNATMIAAPQFDNSDIRYLNQDQLCAVKKNGKWGMISIPSLKVAK